MLSRTNGPGRYRALPGNDIEATTRLRRPSAKPVVLAICTLICLITFLFVVLSSQVQSGVQPATWSGSPWRVVSADPDDPVLEPLATTTLLSQRLFSARCAERWIAEGVLCDELHGRMGKATKGGLDVVWTWVNGSSPELSRWRQALLEGKPTSELAPRRPPTKTGSRVSHFRSHGELLYSLRSSLSLPKADVGRRILLTGGLPTEVDGERVGQVPTWLQGNTGVDVVHHWSVFRTASPPDDMSARRWRDACLPTFNSMAIETQLGHLDTAEAITYMNDDAFVLAPNLTLADLVTPLFGPVLRLQDDLFVDGRLSVDAGDDIEGEWPSLRYSNWLLDRRFGVRKRPYAAHVSKTFLRPLLREMEAVWPDEFARTALVRFRGRDTGIHLSFLATHYVVERHREALVWSFLLGRPYDRDGLVGQLCDAIPAPHAPSLCPNGTIPVLWPTRDALAPGTVDSQLRQAGLAVASTTTYDFSSADGYAYAQLELPTSNMAMFGDRSLGGGMGGPPRAPQERPQGWPNYRSGSDRAAFACHIDVALCFPPDLASPEAIFRHVTYLRPECGDCLIVALVGQSSAKGLEAFLPQAAGSAADERHLEVPLVGGTASSWIDARIDTVPTRSLAVRLIQRYSYVLGHSHSAFFAIRGTALLRFRLDELVRARNSASPPAFAVLNDDMQGSMARINPVDAELARFFEAVWPEPAPWELSQS